MVTNLYYGGIFRQIGCWRPNRVVRKPFRYPGGLAKGHIRHVSASTSDDRIDAAYTRNIGIIAHIDAGKTTTTERMLYYAGHTRRIGDVDDGSTVTDFLPAERARGITIQSAAITFQWPTFSASNPSSDGLPRSAITHSINLIDTPGHADFTFEVRRSLRVLDGAICILDGVAGVEAQTEQVWQQAGEWNIPRIIYINKLDRDGAAFGRTVREIGTKLNIWPAVCEIPWWTGEHRSFGGVVDVVGLQALLYEAGSDGRAIRYIGFVQLRKEFPEIAAEIARARVALVELLSEHDDELVEAFLEANEDHLALTPGQILASLRRCLLGEDCRIAPVFAGASFRNIGVQPLLDAVNNLLPGPLERADAEITVGAVRGSLGQLLRGELSLRSKQVSSKGEFKPETAISIPADDALVGCALAFKVVNDPRKGVLVYFRVYSGSITRNALLYNTNLHTSERAVTLLRMYASESVPVQKVDAGQIGVIQGSKSARTGDTLICYNSNKTTPPYSLEQLQLRPIRVPPPVFFASIEPNSLRDEKDMHEKLRLLLREDPSLHITQDEDTGQTLLSGMGELHLEIAADRLINDLKANARMGKIAIGYRETFTLPSTETHKVFDGEKTKSKGKAGCTITIKPADEDENHTTDRENILHEQDGNVISMQTISLDTKGDPYSNDSVSLPAHLSIQDIRSAYKNGALAALSRGPSHSYPVSGVHVFIALKPEEHIFGSETTYSALTAAARVATIAAFRDVSVRGGTAIMEPIMDVEISVDDASLGSVIHDISSNRGGHIVSLGDSEEADATALTTTTRVNPQKIYAPRDPFEFGVSASATQLSNLQRSVKAKVPLKEMVGYLKHLRSMTGGRGTFVMSFDKFVRMSAPRVKSVVAELRGDL